MSESAVGQPPKTRLIALWSAPRSRSTAFLRMMMERHDLVALHEPFSTLADIGHVRVADRTVRSEQEAIAALRELASSTTVFFKDTTDFRYPGVLTDPTFLREATHTFLIRHPREVIPSHYALNPAVTRDEIGIARLHELFEAVRRATGTPPLVIDSDELISDPAKVVAGYCAHVGIPCRLDAVHWSPSPRREWARASRWHADVVDSAGFEPRRKTYPVNVVNDTTLRRYLRFHLPYYERLRAALADVSDGASGSL